MQTTAARLLAIGLCFASEKPQSCPAMSDAAPAPPPITVDQSEILEP